MREYFVEAFNRKDEFLFGVHEDGESFDDAITIVKRKYPAITLEAVRFECSVSEFKKAAAVIRCFAD